MTTYNYTISPIPYNGGNMIFTAAGYNNHMCCLYTNSTTSRFFAIFGQQNPNYAFGAILDMTGSYLNSASTLAVTTQKVIDQQYYYDQVRCIRLSNSSVLVLAHRYNSSDQIVAYVYTIDGSNNISLAWSQANFLPNQSFSVFQMYASNSYPVNVKIYPEIGVDNQFWIASLEGYQYCLYRYIYNAASPSMTTLAVSSVLAYGYGNNASAQEPFLTKIQDTGNYLFQVRYNTSTGWQSGYVANGSNSYAQVITAGTYTLSYTLPYSPGPLTYIIPLQEHNMLGMSSSGNTLYTYNGTSWSPASTTYNAQTGNYVNQGIALDAYYALLMAEPGGSRNNLYFQVIRYDTATFIESSPPTASGYGLPIFSSGYCTPYNDDMFYYQIDSQTFMFLGSAQNSNRFEVQVVHAS